MVADARVFLRIFVSNESSLFLSEINQEEKQMKNILTIVMLAFFVTGCAQRIGDFTLVSSKNIDLTRGADFKRSYTRIKAEDTVPIILGIPIGIPNMKTALDRAIEKTPGAVALTDGVVSQKIFNFIIFGEMGYEVEGTPLIDPNQEKTYK
ncbi:MAG: hypothetical protein ACR2HF_11325 [Methylococcaceae bacterium]